jgi:hypothetical protein
VLESDRPYMVAVVNDRFLLGTGKRGEAVITIKKRVRKRQAAEFAAKKDAAWTNTPASFSLGAGYEKMERLRVRIATNTDRRIVAVPRIKTYRAVRATYGKGIAKSYIVVAVDVNNSNPSKQFLIQNVSISFDPLQCEALAEMWAGMYFEGLQQPVTLRNKMGRASGTTVGSAPVTADAPTPEGKKNECISKYIEYFGFPNTIMPTDNTTMLAVAAAEKYKSPRYRLFQGIKFAADVGAALPVFNILGPDGRTGFNFLGGTLTTALDAALPKLSDEKLRNLEADIPKSNVIVRGNDTQTVNIFIPAEHVFTQAAWNDYKADLKNPATRDDFKFYMLLFLVANSNGILIDENSKQVESKQGGGARLPVL